MSKLGFYSLSGLARAVKQGEIETVITAFTDHYGRMMGKRCDADFFLEHAHKEVGACNYLLTVNIGMDPLPGFEFTNWESGYGDFILRPDLKTLRCAAWLDKTAIVLCDLLDVETKEHINVAPRSILKAQIDKVASLGFNVMAASELEYYLFNNTYEQARNQHYYDLEPMGWYIEDYHILQGTREEMINAPLRRHLKQSGIEVENSKGEWGHGQHEINVRYQDALGMADNHVLLKQCLKEVAEANNSCVTFMAKPCADTAGSSCHIHLSLLKNKKSAFVGKKEFEGFQCSDNFRYFLAGFMRYLPEFMVFYAPTINSYKRYQSQSWAPTRIAWARDNRTAGFRIVGEGASLRIECRIPGADCNPYLAFSAAIASGLAGIQQQLEPPPIYTGDVYQADDIAKVPHRLDLAINNFCQSEIAKQGLGEAVVNHYAHFYQTEWDAYCATVTDWERQQYFEQI